MVVFTKNLVLFTLSMTKLRLFSKQLNFNYLNIDQFFKRAFASRQRPNLGKMWHGSLIDFYFFILLRFISCCQCNKSIGHGRSDGEIHTINNSDLFIEKRQLDFDEFSTPDVLLDNSTDSSIYDTTTAEPFTGKNQDFNDPTGDSSEKTMYDGTDLTVDINEYTTTPMSKEETTEVHHNRLNRKMKQTDSMLAKKCTFFKKGIAFDLRKMADVWQIAYYRLPNKLKCFKLYIKFVNRKVSRY